MPSFLTYQDIQRGLENGTLSWGDAVLMEENISNEYQEVDSKPKEQYTNTLCLRNLPLGISVFQIITQLSKFCNNCVAKVTIPMTDDGMTRGFAFVRFKNINECIKTIENIHRSNGLFFGKRQSLVEMSRKQTK